MQRTIYVLRPGIDVVCPREPGPEVTDPVVLKKILASIQEWKEKYRSKLSTAEIAGVERRMHRIEFRVDGAQRKPATLREVDALRAWFDVGRNKLNAEWDKWNGQTEPPETKYLIQSQKNLEDYISEHSFPEQTLLSKLNTLKEDMRVLLDKVQVKKQGAIYSESKDTFTGTDSGSVTTTPFDYSNEVNKKKAAKFRLGVPPARDSDLSGFENEIDRYLNPTWTWLIRQSHAEDFIKEKERINKYAGEHSFNEDQVKRYNQLWSRVEEATLKALAEDTTVGMQHIADWSADSGITEERFKADPTAARRAQLNYWSNKVEMWPCAPGIKPQMRDLMEELRRQMKLPPDELPRIKNILLQVEPIGSVAVACAWYNYRKYVDDAGRRPDDLQPGDQLQFALIKKESDDRDQEICLSKNHAILNIGYNSFDSYGNIVQLYGGRPFYSKDPVTGEVKMRVNDNAQNHSNVPLPKFRPDGDQHIDRLVFGESNHETPLIVWVANKMFPGYGENDHNGPKAPVTWEHTDDVEYERLLRENKATESELSKKPIFAAIVDKIVRYRDEIYGKEAKLRYEREVADRLREIQSEPTPSRAVDTLEKIFQDIPEVLTDAEYHDLVARNRETANTLREDPKLRAKIDRIVSGQEELWKLEQRDIERGIFSPELVQAENESIGGPAKAWQDYMEKVRVRGTQVAWEVKTLRQERALRWADRLQAMGSEATGSSTTLTPEALSQLASENERLGSEFKKVPKYAPVIDAWKESESEMEAIGQRAMQRGSWTQAELDEVGRYAGVEIRDAPLPTSTLGNTEREIQRDMRVARAGFQQRYRIELGKVYKDWWSKYSSTRDTLWYQENPSALSLQRQKNEVAMKLMEELDPAAYGAEIGDMRAARDSIKLKLLNPDGPGIEKALNTELIEKDVQITKRLGEMQKKLGLYSIWGESEIQRGSGNDVPDWVIKEQYERNKGRVAAFVEGEEAFQQALLDMEVADNQAQVAAERVLANASREERAALSLRQQAAATQRAERNAARLRSLGLQNIRSAQQARAVAMVAPDLAGVGFNTLMSGLAVAGITWEVYKYFTDKNRNKNPAFYPYQPEINNPYGRH